MAASHWPVLIASYARCKATMELAQAASMLIEGPLKFSQYDIRLGNMVLQHLPLRTTLKRAKVK